VIAVLHDIDQVRQHFPSTLLLARETIAWGNTADILHPDNLRRAKNMAEHWSADAQPCAIDEENAL
jgi:zinc/manganese transport system ATP-binding protein